MRKFSTPSVPVLICVMLFVGAASVFAGLPKWYEHYSNALDAMKSSNWQYAAEQLQSAIQAKDKETNKIRASGVMFVEYFPHRELGICYYQLGNTQSAKQELEFSISQENSARAQEYLSRLNAGETPDLANQPGGQVNQGGINTVINSSSPNGISGTPEKGTPMLVGERLSIAIMPFESSGIGSELQQVDLLDKLVTAFVNTGRFNIFERSKLNRILEEQQLGMSGIIDISTAAEIGKGIGVDAVVVGSISQGGRSVSIDARLIDTETTSVVTSREAFSNSIDLKSVSQMFTEVTQKITDDLPLVHGYVIKMDNGRLTIDIGYDHGLKKGSKCHIYREGAPLVHPVTGEIISYSVEEIGEMLISEVYQVFSVGTISRYKSGTPQVGDRVVTK